MARSMRMSVLLRDIESDSISLDKKTKPLKHNFHLYNFYYKGIRGIPIQFADVFVSLKSDLDTDEPSTSYHSGYFMVTNSEIESVEEWRTFLRLLDPILPNKGDILNCFENKLTADGRVTFNLKYTDTVVVHQEMRGGKIVKAIPPNAVGNCVGKAKVVALLTAAVAKPGSVFLKFLVETLHFVEQVNTMENPFLNNVEIVVDPEANE